MMCEECGEDEDGRALKHCDWCAKALCWGCMPQRKH